ncbi:hypothetical protein ABEB36_004699 [Hypothenemus hampei]|uniref:Protein arginine N-methyltransferase domain-containing protein n=1 Tax=Hypothenemus hampei TaxID=57062 RepID=A0ABD1F799_HYPHA
MLGSSESRVPKIMSQVTSKPNKMNSNFYLNKAKECFKNNNYPNAYENFVNYFDSLEDPMGSTPAVQLGFTKLVCRIGMVLEAANDTEELLKIYLQALNFFPNNYIILNNLGGYLFKMNQVDIARTYLEKAVACCKNYLPAEKNLMHCKWRQMPRWHFKMLNDVKRNSAYYQAIKKCVDKGYKDIIDLGAGCGLLSLIASEDPNAIVTAIEENKILAKMCERIMKENKRNNVKVLNTLSTKYTRPPVRCNLLMTEIFDCALFGEKMLDSLLHAHEVLITEKNDFKIIPCGARLYASAINYQDFQSFRVVNEINLLNLKEMCIRQVDAEPYEAEDLTTKRISYLTEPIKVFDLDFYDVSNLTEIATNYSKIIEFRYNGDNTTHITSIAVWFELDLDEEITISTNPHCGDRVRCWEQGVCHLMHPIEVKKGEIVKFEVTILNNQLKFYQINKLNTCISCWLVSKEIVSFLNDTFLINTITALIDEFSNKAFFNQFKEPQKPVMDLMCFPLLGFMLAAKQGCQFYTAIKTDCDFRYVDFFDHILRTNNISDGKMIVVENQMARNSILCGVHRYLKECKACLIDPISSDGSIHPTMGLKEKLAPDEQHDILMLPTKIVVKVMLIYSEQLEMWNVVNDQNLFNYKIAQFMNEYTGCEHPDLDMDFAYKEYSNPISFTVDDKDFVKRTQNVLVTETGHINALYTWYELQFYGSINFSTKGSSHMKKTCYLLEHRPVELGDVFRIVMRREGTYLDFRLEE